MWVIYDTDTGVEVDRIEDWKEAKELVRRLNNASVYDHFAKRWEN